jgi:hypothetical protein
MDDTLSIKSLDATTLDSANFPGTARSFPRVASSASSEQQRRSLFLGSLSPTTIAIAHTPRKNGVGLQRSVVRFDQSLARVDGDDILTGTDRQTINIQQNLPVGVTEDEYIALLALAVGALSASNWALARSTYNLEQ